MSTFAPIYCCIMIRECNTCKQNLSFGNPEDFEHHKKICPKYFPRLKTEDDGQIKCILCKRNFLNYKGAFRHLASTHFKGQYSRPKSSFTCTKCGKITNSSKHEKICEEFFDLVKESVNGSWRCKACGKIAPDQRSIYLHIQKKHKEGSSLSNHTVRISRILL